MKGLALTQDAVANILCIDQFSNLGGGQKSLLDLLPAFTGHGWRPSVACPGEGSFPEMVQSLGYRTHNFTSGSYAIKKKTLAQHVKYALELPGLIRYFTKLVETEKVDLLYVNGPRLVPSAAWVAWRTGTPIVFHCHNRLFQGSAITLAGQALELAGAHVIACCEYVAEPLKEYVAPEHLRVIYNGTNEMRTGKWQPIGAGIKRIGVIGRIEEEKGQLKFAEAARLVSHQVPDCHFEIIGAPMFSSTDYYHKVVASSAGLPIDFLDWRDNMAEIYAGLDLLVVPSSPAEATTRVILEAYSAGVPVVAFPVGGIPEILRDGQIGFLSEAHTVEALARRIISVLQMDRTWVATVTQRARDEWSRRFTIESYRNSVCAVMTEAMQPHLSCVYDEDKARAGAFSD